VEGSEGTNERRKEEKEATEGSDEGRTDGKKRKGTFIHIIVSSSPYDNGGIPKISDRKFP
jgi:hypothetical protein